MDPDKPAIYVAQSKIPDSYNAFITPENPTVARNPPPDPKIAITGTWENIQYRCFLRYLSCNNTSKTLYIHGNIT